MGNVIQFPIGNKGSKDPRSIGESFTTDTGKQVEESYGYLKPTGFWNGEDGNENIEVFCVKTGNTRFVSLKALHSGLVTDLDW